MQRITPEFEHEYEEELTELFRARLLWYLATMIVLTLGSAGLVIGAAQLQSLLTDRAANLLQVLLATAIPTIPACIVYGCGLAWTLRRTRTRSDLLKTVWWIIQLDVLVQTLVIHGAIKLGVIRLDEPGWFAILLSHTIACLFIPWTVRQCLQAFAPQLWIWAMGLALFTGGVSAVFPDVFFAPLVAVPGVLICAWRMQSLERSFDHRMVRRAFSTIKRELVDARRLHESLFPPPITQGAIRLAYSYQPMRQIGGDYLHTHTDEFGRLHVVLIDVTGHGIAAALTVNRLAGEIERLHAEGLATADLNQDGQLDPGELLTALNRYIWLTLSRHSVFATALCIRLDPGDGDRPGVLAWASGGHPPALVRRASGGLDELDSTTFLLGAIPPDQFDAEEQSLPLSTGDCVIAYTDGAFENADRFGRAFGLKRLRETIAASPRTEIECVQYVRRVIDMFRHGPNDDDILIVAASMCAAGVLQHKTDDLFAVAAAHPASS
ncbi:MAG: SpoIIE family protein phosphatase [Phycisphaerales bacterium]|nr:SpoIIE family protein phosphatase [Phycisphaerales bacterium]